MDTVAQLPMESMSNVHMTCVNRLFGGRSHVNLELPQGQYILAWNVIAPKMRYACALHLSCGGESVSIYLDDYAPLCNAQGMPSEALLRTMPSNLVCTALNVMLEPFLRQASEFFGKICNVQAIRLHDEHTPLEPEVTQGKNDATGFGFTLRQEQNNTCVHALLVVDAASYFMERLSMYWQEEAAAQHRPLSHIPLRFTPVLDRFTLPYAALKHLQRNACFFGARQLEFPVQIRCYVGKKNYFLGTYDKTTLRMEGIYMTDENTAHDTLPQSSEQTFERGLTGSFNPENIPVTVTFALDSRELTVGQVAAMQAGEVFLTSCDADEPVSVLVNGQCMGKGRLVSVGGRVGVQILSINTATE